MSNDEVKSPSDWSQVIRILAGIILVLAAGGLISTLAINPRPVQHTFDLLEGEKYLVAPPLIPDAVQQITDAASLEAELRSQLASPGLQLYVARLVGGGALWECYPSTAPQGIFGFECNFFTDDLVWNFDLREGIFIKFDNGGAGGGLFTWEGVEEDPACYNQFGPGPFPENGDQIISPPYDEMIVQDAGDLIASLDNPPGCVLHVSRYVQATDSLEIYTGTVGTPFAIVPGEAYIVRNAFDCDFCCPPNRDSDQDGYGNGPFCPGPSDCDDTDPDVNPGMPEICNGIDDNCNTLVDEDNPGGGVPCDTGLPGICGPGQTLCIDGQLLCEGPGAECELGGPCSNGLDDDCDGAIDELDDADSDGVDNCVDNCCLGYNPDQLDVDPPNGIGDACEVVCEPPPLLEVGNQLKLGRSGYTDAVLDWDCAAPPPRRCGSARNPCLTDSDCSCSAEYLYCSESRGGCTVASDCPNFPIETCDPCQTIEICEDPDPAETCGCLLNPGSCEAPSPNRRYNIYIGYKPPFDLFVYNHQCLDSYLPGPPTIEPLEPQPFWVLYYLVSSTCAEAETSLGFNLLDPPGSSYERQATQCPTDAMDADQDGIIDRRDNCLGLANSEQADADSDGSGDPCDNCIIVLNPLQTDTDGDCLLCTNDACRRNCGNACEDDDDNDGVSDAYDRDPLTPSVCTDADGDGCDDCTEGRDGFGPEPDTDPANDGPDLDGDGLCDLGDDDSDDDGVPDDGDDSGDPDDNPCPDGGGPFCDDNCRFAPNPLQEDDDGDLVGDACDACDTFPDNLDDDLDGVPDLCDICPGFDDNQDTDGDGDPDGCDSDDDNDSVPDPVDLDPLDPQICDDVEPDTCDDCSQNPSSASTPPPWPLYSPNPLNDGPDTDGDGFCDASTSDVDGDLIPDDDGDGTFDPCTGGNTVDCDDNCPFVPNPQTDPDDDGVGELCDNCTTDPNPSQTDTDGDCLGCSPPFCECGDACEDDDDNDNVPDLADSEPLDPQVCEDVDLDTCDDCSQNPTSASTPNVPPWPPYLPDPLDDGPDTDANGECDANTPDIDGDLIPDDDGDGTFNPCVGGNTVDCDDNCPVDFNPNQFDDDGDGVGNVCDNCRFDPNRPQDDSDGDCAGCPPPLCDQCGDACDTDNDNDGEPNVSDNCPFVFNPPEDCDMNAGTPDEQCNNDDPFDADGDACDVDDDNDGVPDLADLEPFNPFVCTDWDGDTCDDCSATVDGLGPLPDFDPANDGPDIDGDGLCDFGDNDNDNDGIPDDDGDGSFDPCTGGNTFDCDDNCPFIFNPNQEDGDSDGIGDACE